MVVIRNRLQRSLGGDDENIEDFLINNADDILTQNAINDVRNDLNDLSLVDELSRSFEAEDDHDSLLEHQLAEAVVNQRSQRRKAKKKEEKKATRPQQTWQCLGARGRSHHKHRRYEQADLLTRKYAAIFSDFDGDSLWAETEMALSISDFIPKTVESAFARYIRERGTMKAWNDFIECTEDQQENLLKGKDANAEQDDENDENRPPKSRKSKSKSKGDKRNRHPSYSADECFMRLDSELRTMLRKRRVPFGVLASIEESVTDFFNSSPMAEYKDRLPGFQRLLLHACCQYMDLHCQSFDEDGVRWSRVKNRRDVFIPPPVMLADYLRYRKGGPLRQRSASEHSPL